VANIYEPEYDEEREQPGFRARRARVGLEAGAERLGLSVWELPAGEAAYPYHHHLGEEELLVVLEGTPELRTPEGWRRLRAGEVVAFPRGEDGAHQIANRSEQTVRFLALSTHGDPDIVLYPDSGKLSAAERRPQGGGMREVFRLADAVDYWDGEQPPASS
jgi:uncharacterized cupin superfamily protein